MPNHLRFLTLFLCVYLLLGWELQQPDTKLHRR
jgi:hypothetical protein